MQREIVKIDEEKCNGCGQCVPNCHEGALQIIDRKAILVSDLLCDGLGACVGHCPVDAITIEKREAEPYDEVKVMADMVKKTKNVVIAHLRHLKEHNETAYLKQGMQYLVDNKNVINFNIEEVLDAFQETGSTAQNKMAHGIQMAHHHEGGGCPGSRTMAFVQPVETASSSGNQVSQLSHWPIQLHLIQPAASHFHKSDLLIAADCTAFSFGNFHNDFLKGRKLVIACPKLDSNKDIYVEKITRLIDESQVNTITVMIMEVPCCGGLLQMVQMAAKQAKRKVPIKNITIGIQGNIISEEWV
jgi:NAD-dependent dihydropyrimidine dehydrogenase PreA subunit